MVSPIQNKVKRIWDKWNLRGFIILSLALQTFLILCAPFRKRTSNKWVVFPVWLAYLLADWAANFAIGLISSSQGETEGTKDDGDLLAFWAPFLLLHLGGPDTIIAIAIEDNALWPRHFLGLIFQVLAVVYVFIQSHSQNKLWLPTFLLFIAGTIKYAERTRALYLASLDGIKEGMLKLKKKPDPGPDYEEFMDEYSSRKDAQLPIEIKMAEHRNENSNRVTDLPKEGELDKDDIPLVRYAYLFFAMSKGLVIGVPFSFDGRSDSRLFFLSRISVEAYKLIAMELNFIYEALYTKAVVVHSKLGYCCRALSFTAVCIALFFFGKLDKHRFQSFDVQITYSLLYVAIGLDSISIFKLLLSDWIVATLKTSWLNSWIVRKYLNLKKSTFSSTKPANSFFRRWSESVSAFNLLDYALKELPSPKRIPLIDYCGTLGFNTIEFLGLKDFRDNMMYTSSKPLTKELWDFIFEELRSKSQLAEDPQIGKKICSARGELVLREHHCSDVLLSYIVDLNYDKSLLLWHIATDLCYNEEEDCPEDYRSLREHSKTLSDYMLYLLVMQPTVMSSLVRIGRMEFQDTCAEAKGFFTKWKLQKVKDACIRILKVNTDLKPVAVKGDLNKSVLFDACILAKELRRRENKWNIISQVWVELLSYAASHCGAKSHAELLSKGGELVTFVWLLMAHFGIAEQFEVKEDLSKLILIVGK